MEPDDKFRSRHGAICAWVATQVGVKDSTGPGDDARAGQVLIRGVAGIGPYPASIMQDCSSSTECLVDLRERELVSSGNRGRRAGRAKRRTLATRALPPFYAACFEAFSVSAAAGSLISSTRILASILAIGIVTSRTPSLTVALAASIFAPSGSDNAR